MSTPEEWTETEITAEDRIVRTSCGECGHRHYGVVRYLDPELYPEAEERYREQQAARRARRQRLLRLGRAAERAHEVSHASSAEAGARIPAVAVSPVQPNGRSRKTDDADALGF